LQHITQFYFFAILLAKAQLYSILKDVVEMSILSISRKTPPLPSKKKRRKNKQGKERKETTYTKKGRVRLLTSPEVVQTFHSILLYTLLQLVCSQANTNFCSSEAFVNGQSRYTY